MFCGGGPLSNEHVVPRWCVPLFERDPPITATRQSVRDEPIRDGWVQRSLDLTVRKVCRACNNGWMANLEGNAAPKLGPLIAAPTPATLDSEVMDLLAVWGTKMVLVSQLMVERHPPIIPPEQYRWFFEHKAPFEESKAWVGAYRLTEHSAWSSSTARMGPVGGGAWRSTVNVGSLVFQLLHIPQHKWVLRTAWPPAKIRHYIARLYPRSSNTLRWPPKEVMDGQALHLVSAIGEDAWAEWRA